MNTIFIFHPDDKTKLREITDSRINPQKESKLLENDQNRQITLALAL